MSVVRAFPRPEVRRRSVLGAVLWRLTCSRCGRSTPWTRSPGRATRLLGLHGQASPGCADLVERPEAQTRTALGLDPCGRPHIGQA